MNKRRTLLTAAPVLAGVVAGYLLHAGAPQPRWLRHSLVAAHPVVVQVQGMNTHGSPAGAPESYAQGARVARAQRDEAPTASAADPFDPNERKRLYQEQLAAHDAEPVDAQWARQVEAKLGDHLARTSRQRWKATGVSCRTTTCTATLEWTSYRDAVLSYNHVLSGRSESDPNCARMVMLPEPADANAAYSARAIFDCTETR